MPSLPHAPRMPDARPHPAWSMHGPRLMSDARWLCACSANEKFPELKNIQTLPAHEMAVRLCFLFDHYDKHPLCEEDIDG